MSISNISKPASQMLLISEERGLLTIARADTESFSTLSTKQYELGRELSLKIYDLLVSCMKKSDVKLIGFKLDGSGFTSARIICSTLNMLSMLGRVKLIGGSGDDWINQIQISFAKENFQALLLPHYQRPARITKPRK